MAPKAPIDSAQMISDIRAGMIDAQIMRKYNLSAHSLRDTYSYLIENGNIRLQEVFRRPVWYNAAEDDPRRRLPRHYLSLLLPITVANKPEQAGWVSDINDEGFSARGIEMEAGDVQTFAMKPRQPLEVGEILCEAECQWKGEEGPDDVPVCGFRITRISKQDLEELRKFIRFVTMGN